MKDIEIVKKLVGLEKEVDILRIEEEKINDKICKVIHVSNGNKRVRCIYCGKYTRKVHDKLKPVRIKYLKIAGYITYLEVYKRRFNCPSCGKRFTEDNYINGNKKTISNKTIQNILIDLKEYNLSLKYIAKINNVSDNTIRNVLKEAMKTYPTHLKKLPSIISFDEFSAHTKAGKYAFIVNDIIHKKVLDILPSRKKEYLIQYFTHIENRYSVQYIVSDIYEPYLLVTTIMFPKAKYVVDRFHYIMYTLRCKLMREKLISL